VRVATWTVAVLVAVSVPMILVVNGFRVLATDTFVDWELGRDGFPPDLYGFDTEQRTALAKLGLRSIEPGSEGIVLLERATLADGSAAFRDRELTHMRDVRTLFGAALRVQLVALLAIVALGLLLWRTRLRAAVPAGLLAGSLATLAIAVLAVPVILLGFDGFFVRFHEIFFSGDSWEFSTL
jgi:integral membrane protein (TIGR01906 family)